MYQFDKKTNIALLNTLIQYNTDNISALIVDLEKIGIDIEDFLNDSFFFIWVNSANRTAINFLIEYYSLNQKGTLTSKEIWHLWSNLFNYLTLKTFRKKLIFENNNKKVCV